jgi:hypothetical protein
VCVEKGVRGWKCYFDCDSKKPLKFYPGYISDVIYEVRVTKHSAVALKIPSPHHFPGVDWTRFAFYCQEKKKVCI